MLNLDQMFGPGARVFRQSPSLVALTPRNCARSAAELYTIARAIMLDGPRVESRVIDYHIGGCLFPIIIPYERHSIA